MPPQCAQDARRAGHAETTRTRLEPALPPKLGAGEACRHTVGVVEASDVRADGRRDHPVYADSPPAEALHAAPRGRSRRADRRTAATCTVPPANARHERQ